MASATALAHCGKQTLKMLYSVREIEKILCVQLFGKDPGAFALAAKVAVEHAGADIIDLNFGCPARKVISSGHGGALLKDPQLCQRLVSAVSGAVDAPVTVKLRPGFSRQDGPIALDLAPKLVEAGAAAITLHPRYVTDRFGGQADWSLIEALAETVSVPVIGSGDITDPKEAVFRLKTSGVKAVMIGRASRGRPWIFKQCLDELRTGSHQSESLEERLRTAVRHARLLEEQIGPKAVFRLRSILIWYTLGLPGAAALRAKICREESIDNQLSLLSRTIEDMRKIEG
jgi:nifR3 family TIM-barrel protein